MYKKYRFYVIGMHCNSCVHTTESKLAVLPNIKSVRSNLVDMSIEVEGNFENMTDVQVAQELTVHLKSDGYSISIEKPIVNDKWSDFKIALPIALGFVLIFLVLQKVGLVSIVSADNVTYGTAFIIGIIASLSSCMAVVGGLLLSMSATFAKAGDMVRPQIIFHFSRLVSFFILGGVIGVIGKAFTLNSSGTFVLSLFIAMVMIVLGINLLDVFPWARKLQISMPKFIISRTRGISSINNTFTPIIMGTATFFLPCGFTQSMQLYTLGTGSFLGGGFTMIAFALGTLPVLALISFSSFSIRNSSKSGIFFKTVGLIVIIFGLFNLINSLVIIGLISPVFNF